MPPAIGSHGNEDSSGSIGTAKSGSPCALSGTGGGNGAPVRSGGTISVEKPGVASAAGREGAGTAVPTGPRWAGRTCAGPRVGLGSSGRNCGKGAGWIVGCGPSVAVPVGAGVGVGLGVAVSIGRGATGTGPSVSTGPWTSGLPVGVGAGGSWKSRASCPAAEACIAARKSGMVRRGVRDFISMCWTGRGAHWRAALNRY